eukprot:1123848-Prorocentrum_lima.AAC.1
MATQRALGPSARENAGRTPHQLLAGDVWDLCTDQSPQRAQLLHSIPEGALCLMVGGTPCQQLTTIGNFQGRQGPCGPDSRHFYAFPTLARLIQEERPDVHLHAVLENAA